jgi:hypothetical protein
LQLPKKVRAKRKMAKYFMVLEVLGNKDT